MIFPLRPVWHTWHFCWHGSGRRLKGFARSGTKSRLKNPLQSKRILNIPKLVCCFKPCAKFVREILWIRLADQVWQCNHYQTTHPEGSRAEVYQSPMQQRTISFYDVCFALVMAADGACSLPTKQQDMVSPRELMSIMATRVSNAPGRVNFWQS